MIIAVTLPLIPIFAVLIGLHTQAQTQRQWQLLARLGGHFLDVVAGLPTLKLFGRAKAQAAVIGEVTERAPARHHGAPCGSRSCPPSCWSWPPRWRPRWSRSRSGSGCWPGT